MKKQSSTRSIALQKLLRPHLFYICFLLPICSNAFTNSEPPEITSDCGNKEFCSAENECETATIELTILAEDDLTATTDLEYSYTLTLDSNNDGTPDAIQNPVNAQSVNGNFTYGTHHISWTVTDSCDNTTSCDYLFTVKDCQEPIVYAHNGLAIEIYSSQSCTGTLEAIDFNAGSFDNCGIAELRIITPSYGPDQFMPPEQAGTSITLNATNLGTNTVDLWARDVNDNWNYTTSYIIVQNNDQSCDPPMHHLNINGKVQTLETSPNPIEEVTIYAYYSNGIGIPYIPGQSSLTTITDINGEYSINNSNFHNYSVTIEPKKEASINLGLTAIDVYLLQRHILGVDLFTEPYQYIAGDVNNSGSLTALDIVAMRKAVLLIADEWPNNSTWKFQPESQIFTINDFGNSDIQADFTGIKIGNISDALTGFIDQTRTANGQLNLSIDNTSIPKGEEYTVDFKSRDISNIIGFQFTLGFDKEAFDLKEISNTNLNGLNSESFGLHLLDQGFITAMWTNPEQLSTDSDEVLFSITFTAKKEVALKDALNINSRYTTAEAYSKDLDLFEVQLLFENMNGVDDQLQLFQNHPNPVKDNTVIAFHLPEASAASIKIVDISGKVLKLIQGNYPKGYNEIKINKSDLSSAGVLYYQLETKRKTLTKKMIVLQ